MAIIFLNPGIMDLRGLRAFGVNAKTNTNPLGFFGTGSKYAVSGLLRSNCTITLWLGADKYLFGVKRDAMRGKEFDFVTLTHPDGRVEELPYTLELGKTWEPWQFFRELHSNALDEGGSTIRGSYQPLAGQTAFVVEGNAIEEAYNERNKIFLSSKPIIVSEKIDVHMGSSEYVYYRGVRVAKLLRPSIYTYSLKKLNWGLTEDRTLREAVETPVALNKLISTCEDTDFLRNVLVASPDTYEHHIADWWAEAPSSAFERVYEELRKEGRAAALTCLANTIWKVKHKSLPLPDPVEMTSIQRKQLKRAIEFCRKIGYSVDEFPIVVVPQARDGLMALAEGGRIVLTVGCFNQGTKIVAQALIEEWMHLKFNFSDMTRTFQTHLFEQLVTLGERLVDDPL